MAKMMNSVKLLVPALGFSLVLSAYAQGTAGQPGQPAGPQQTRQAVVTTQPAASAAAQQQRAQARRDARLSQLIGMNVRDPAGENLGDINDVIVDLNLNRALYAVIGFGGFLGMGERLFAFPLQAFEMPLGREQLVLNVPRERLRESPGFDRDQWPDWNDTAYRGEVDRYHSPVGGPGLPAVGMAPARSTAPAATAGTGLVGQPAQPGQQPGQIQPAPAAQQTPAQTADRTATRGQQITQVPQMRRDQPQVATQHQMQQFVRGSELLDRTVRDATGENIGSVDDVVVNMVDGELRYAVIGFSQGWFRQDELVAVPIEGLARTPQYPNDVSLNATREQLERAPAFDRDKWPDFRDEQYQSAWDRFLSSFRGDRTPTAAVGGTAAGAPTTAPAATTGGAATGTTGATGTVGTNVIEAPRTQSGGTIGTGATATEPARATGTVGTGAARTQ